MSKQFSGTKEVAENLAFSLDDLNKYLRKKEIDISLISECKQFKGGQSNPTYLLTGNGKNYVLRRKPPGKLLKSAHAVDREYRVISALKDTPVPTPKTYHLCEDPKVIGTDFYIMEYCDGVIYWDPVASEINTERRKGIFDQLNFGISALHSQN